VESAGMSDVVMEEGPNSQVIINIQSLMVKSTTPQEKTAWSAKNQQVLLIV